MDKTGQLLVRKSIIGKVNVAEKVPVHDKYPEYEGSYQVTPLVSEQTLPTNKRSMEQDVTVEAINYLEVPNPQGGSTVTIGFE